MESNKRWFCAAVLPSTGKRFLYHFPVHELAERLLKTIRKQQSILPGDRVAVAVSGGADSVALLCLLLDLQADLGIVLSVAHVNHRLRQEESDEDERFVSNLAQTNGLELHTSQAPATGTRSITGSGIEAAGRELRYSFFRQLARESRVQKIATAHTLDDQAETLLLRIFRGTGIRGLSGIQPRIIFEEQGEVVRPLLSFRRAALREFLRQRGQNWREDSSNRDIAFLRNRVRHRLLPIIGEEFGEAAIEHMAELAEIARAETEAARDQDEHWQNENRRQSHPEVKEAEAAPLPLAPLISLPLANRRRLVRAWLETNTPDVSISFRLIEEVLDLMHGTTGHKLELSPHLNLRRARHELLLEPTITGRDGATNYDYEYSLTIPGTVKIPELSASIAAHFVEADRVPEHDRSQLLDPARLPKEVVIRNWRAGDRFWPPHSAGPKKVKELLSDRHATGAEKKLWPVAHAEGCGLIWMRGFAVPSAFRIPEGASQAIWIRETPDMM